LAISISGDAICSGKAVECYHIKCMVYFGFLVGKVGMENRGGKLEDGNGIKAQQMRTARTAQKHREQFGGPPELVSGLVTPVVAWRRCWILASLVVPIGL
jgi:hypothetical protein